jgi:peptidoglycan/xylan/chitin deacetylase (PgdA/CDA1 family)
MCPGGKRGRLAIFIYHRVLAKADPMLPGDIDASGFTNHMQLLAHEFNVLPLGEACERLRQGKIPPRAVSVTFDDGYADNEEVALPILKRLGLSATVFVSTGFSGGGMMFNDTIIETLRHAKSGSYDLSDIGLGELRVDDLQSRRAAVERFLPAVMHRPLSERQFAVERIVDTLGAAPQMQLMMTPQQILNLHRSGMTIGAHTVRHPILKSIPDDEARAEIVRSKRILEDIVGTPVHLFAYPNGKPGRDYDKRHVQLVREAGFAAAVSTTPGIADRASDQFQLPRFGPWETNPRRLGMRLLLSCTRSAAV